MDVNIDEITRFGFKKIEDKDHYKNEIIISKTGYTGSEGYEIYIYNDDIIVLWNQLLNLNDKYNLLAAGLGARDTLRLEMGYCLYGNDINEDTTPYEANLMWATNLNKDFIGKDRLVDTINKSNKRMINFKMVDRGVPRKGNELFNSEKIKIGYVTSGTYSPSSKVGIGIGYVTEDNCENLFVKIRDKFLRIMIVKLPIHG